MPKKLAVLAVMLVTLLGMAAPALAQDPSEVPAQDEVPACVLADACQNTSAQHQVVEEQPAVAPAPDDIDQPFEAASEDNSGFQYDGQLDCSECGKRAAQAAQDAITRGDSDTGTDPTDAFDAAIDAAHSPGGTGDAAASEQAEAPVRGIEAATYRAAFEAAKEAGLDDVAAKDNAEDAVADARKTHKGGSPSEGIAAAEGKARKDQDSKDRGSKDKAQEGATDDEETTTEEVVVSAEKDEAADENAEATPVNSRAPLLLGGVGLLAVGGYAALQFTRSWPLTRGNNLLGD